MLIYTEKHHGHKRSSTNHFSKASRYTFEFIDEDVILVDYRDYH